MPSKVGIVNIALGHIGVGRAISNLETESSQEAITARLFYDLALETVLRDSPWPFAAKIAVLSLIEEEPNTEWAFSYRYPTDCIMFRRVLSGLRNDSRQSRAPYKLAQDDSGTIIFTDEEDAQAEYTIRADNPQFFPPDFTLAFSYLLASLMAPKLTGGDPFKLGVRALQLYQYEIFRAKAAAGNESQPEEEPESEFVRARS